MIPLISIPIFLIYMNAPVVLVLEHGLPRPLAFLVPLLLAVPVIYRVAIRGEALRFPGMIIAALLMLVCHTLSAMVSDQPHVALDVVFTWLVEGVLLAFLLVNALRSRREVFTAARTIVTAGALMGLLVLIQQILGPGEYSMAGFGQFEGENPDVVQHRLAGPIGEVNRFAQVLVVLIPVAAGLTITAPPRQRWWYWTATLFICAGVALTFSRGAMVAMALVMPVALLVGFLRLRHLVVGLILGAVLMMAIPNLAVRVASIGDVAFQSLGLDSGGFRNADGASRGRATEMKAAGLMFIDYPLFGVGPGMAPEHYPEYAQLVGGKVRVTTRRSHNLYLQLAAETGVIGLCAFLSTIWVVLYSVDVARRRAECSDRELWGLVCGLELAVLILLATSIFLHAAYIRYFWLLLALAVAAARLAERSLQSQVLPPVIGNTQYAGLDGATGTSPRYAQPLREENTLRRSGIATAGRGKKLRNCLLGIALLVCAPVVAFEASQVDTSMSNTGIWISPMEVMALPVNGPEWDALVAQAQKPIAPNLSDQSDPSNVRVLARALVATRTGSKQAREEVLLALEQVQGTETGARALAVSRELMAYVIAAELIGLEGERRDDFESWLRVVREQAFQGRSLHGIHEGRPNNWGTHAGASRLAVAIYLSDRDEIEQAAWVFRGYTGDVNGWDNFKFGERWWQPDNVCRDYGIAPSGSRIGTHHIGGVLPDEMRRGGPFRWPPPKVNYVYEALQGAVAQAVMLERLGMPAWEWGDRALLRAFTWLHEQADYPAEGDDTWMPHVVNKAYGTGFPAPIPARPGKATGFADWTHGRAVP